VWLKMLIFVCDISFSCGKGFFVLWHVRTGTGIQSFFDPVSSGVKLRSLCSSWPLKMGRIGCPETSVRNYHHPLRNSCVIAPGGSEIFRSRPDRSWGPPSFLYNGYRSFPSVKRPGRAVDHPPSSSAEVEGSVELYICSPSGTSWPVLGWNLSYCHHLTLHCVWMFMDTRFRIIVFSKKRVKEMAFEHAHGESRIRLWALQWFRRG